MTADIKLLPLPDMMDGDAFVVSDEGDEVWVDFYGENSMEDFARANVLHHTAAKDAEIERLRAELEIEEEQAEFYCAARNWQQRKAAQQARKP